MARLSMKRGPRRHPEKHLSSSSSNPSTLSESRSALAVSESPLSRATSKGSKQGVQRENEGFVFFESGILLHYPAHLLTLRSSSTPSGRRESPPRLPPTLKLTPIFTNESQIPQLGPVQADSNKPYGSHRLSLPSLDKLWKRSSIHEVSKYTL